MEDSVTRFFLSLVVDILWRCNGDLPVDCTAKMRGTEPEHDRTHAHVVHLRQCLCEAGALGRIFSEQEVASLSLARTQKPAGTRPILVELPTCSVMLLPQSLRTTC